MLDSVVKKVCSNFIGPECVRFRRINSSSDLIGWNSFNSRDKIGIGSHRTGITLMIPGINIFGLGLFFSDRCIRISLYQK